MNVQVAGCGGDSLFGRSHSNVITMCPASEHLVSCLEQVKAKKGQIVTRHFKAIFFLLLLLNGPYTFSTDSLYAK